MSARGSNDDNSEGVVPVLDTQPTQGGALSPKRLKLDGESSSSSVEVLIENVDQMAASYVRTRHKNVRCFPRCGTVHKSKSFCGHSVYVLVKGDGLRKEDVIIVGEFRNVRTAPSFAIGQDVPISNFDECFTEGVLLKQDGKDLSFAINPIRKWKFDGKIRPMDHYVFTVFAIVGGKVMAKMDTPSFTITPIWKTEGKDDGVDEEPSGRANSAPSIAMEGFKPATPPSGTASSAAFAHSLSRAGADALSYSQKPSQQLLLSGPSFLQQNLMFPMPGSTSVPHPTQSMPSVALPSFMQQHLPVPAAYGMLSGPVPSPRAGLIPASPPSFTSQQRPNFPDFVSDPRAMMYNMMREAEFQQKQQMMGRMQLAPVHAVPAPTQLVAPRAPFPAHFLQIHKGF